jgi:hypothetical protein
MISITGAQNRLIPDQNRLIPDVTRKNASAGEAAGQTAGQAAGKSDQGVGHRARTEVEGLADPAPNALGKAASAIAKLHLDNSAA